MSKVVIENYFVTGINEDKPCVRFWITDGTSFTENKYIELTGTNFDNENFRGLIVETVLDYVNDPGGLNLDLSEEDIYNLPQ